jgi:hypothetical protein
MSGEPIGYVLAQVERVLGRAVLVEAKASERTACCGKGQNRRANDPAIARGQLAIGHDDEFGLLGHGEERGDIGRAARQIGRGQVARRGGTPVKHIALEIAGKAPVAGKAQLAVTGGIRDLGAGDRGVHAYKEHGAGLRALGCPVAGQSLPVAPAG